MNFDFLTNGQYRTCSCVFAGIRCYAHVANINSFCSPYISHSIFNPHASPAPSINVFHYFDTTGFILVREIMIRSLLSLRAEAPTTTSPSMFAA